MSWPPLAAPWDNTPPTATPPALAGAWDNTAPKPARPALDSRRNRGVELSLESGQIGITVKATTVGGAASRWELRDAAGEFVSAHVVPHGSTGLLIDAGSFPGGSLVLVSDPDGILSLDLTNEEEGKCTALSVRRLSRLGALHLRPGHETPMDWTVTDCPRLETIEYHPVVEGDPYMNPEGLTLARVPALKVAKFPQAGLSAAAVTAVLLLLAATRAGKGGTRTAVFEECSAPTAAGAGYAAHLVADGWTVFVEEGEDGGE